MLSSTEPAAPFSSALAQLLYLPSLGACVLAGCLLRRRGIRRSTTPFCAPDGGKSFTKNRRNKTRVLPNSEEKKQGPPLLSLSGRPCNSPSRSPGATRAPACSSSSALLPSPKLNTEKGIARRRKLALGSFSPPAKHTAVVIVLLSWAVFFGGVTVRRCREWKSEKALFESALDVCPDGIKTLNNVAVGMLNEEEAGRAEVYLRRAVEVGLCGS